MLVNKFCNPSLHLTTATLIGVFTASQRISKNMRLQCMGDKSRSFKGLHCEGCMLGMQLGEVDVDDMKIDIRSDEHILWANNIETDNAYWSWQRSLTGLLRPVFPGQMHQIQRNLLNLVAIIDPGTLEGLR